MSQAKNLSPDAIGTTATCTEILRAAQDDTGELVVLRVAHFLWSSTQDDIINMTSFWRQ